MTREQEILLKMAKKALSADTSSDLISRANAIRWVKTECNQYGKPTLDYDSGLKVIEHLKKMPSELPSAEAEQVTGKLKNPCDSLLKSDSDECKEQKSKLDLIRREDAIGAIDDAIDADSPQWAILRTKIGFLPSAEAEWIPCSERLPEVGEICLLTVREYGWNCKDYTRVIIGEYSDNYADHILAWMPLPKPYKGGAEE